MGIQRANVSDTLQRLGLQGAGVQRAYEVAATQRISLRKAAEQVDGVDWSALAQVVSATSGLPILHEIDMELFSPS